MVSISFLYPFSGGFFALANMSKDISFYGRKLPLSDVSILALVPSPRLATGNRNRYLVAEWLPKLRGNWQPQLAPLKGCASSCGLPLPVSATLAHGSPSPKTTYAAILSGLSVVWIRDISCNSGIYPFIAKAFRARGRGCANADGSRACMCEPDRLSAVSAGQVGRVERRSEGKSGRGTGARGLFRGRNLVTIL